MKYLIILLLVTLALTSSENAAAARDIPVFEGIGTHSRKIATDSAEAQQFFDQGLAFLYAFNHDEAIRSFEEAARIDPECAMAHWGIALACGPHINNPVVPEHRAKLAWKELMLAQKYAPSASLADQSLIASLSRRYADPQPEDRTPLDRDYAEAMRKTRDTFPEDADIGALFAESLMDLRPWDLWTADLTPQPGTGEIISILQQVLKLDANHPLANHLFIHTVEAGPNPEMADEAADRLRDLQPGMGHNVHMPSHIDVLRGRWHQAIAANQKAIRADLAYRETTGKRPDFFRLYMAHNRHMLAYAAMMTGQSELALTHINAMLAEMPSDWLKDNAVFADAFAAMPYEVLIRFGRWDEILEMPEPEQYLPFSIALHHASRSVARAARGEADIARIEQQAFLTACEAVPEEWIIGNNTCADVLELVTHMLDGEIAYREGEVEDGLASLRTAVSLEDQLRYDEPPGWIMPVRHTLGATLMQERRFSEAETVYREDLKKRPENGWALFGLAECLKLQDRTDEAAPIYQRFKAIWARADLTINSTCLCQPGL